MPRDQPCRMIPIHRHLLRREIAIEIGEEEFHVGRID
jgi:hypothetical protein